MQIVIDIPEETVKEIKDNAMFAKDIADNIKWDVTGAIVNGRPLLKGHWIAEENEEMETIGYYCSECDLPMETEEKTNYCPNCGAKMEEDK